MLSDVTVRSKGLILNLVIVSYRELLGLFFLISKYSSLSCVNLYLNIDWKQKNIQLNLLNIWNAYNRYI